MKEQTERETRRGRMDIIASILRTARDGVKTTHLIYRANLSFKQLQSYLDLLLKNHLLGITVDSTEGKIYRTTPKGRAFLEHYRIVEEILS